MNGWHFINVWNMWMFHEVAHEQLTFDKCRLCETYFWIESSLKKTYFLPNMSITLKDALYGSTYTYHSSDISEKMKTMILATTLFSNWPKKQLHLIWNIRLDFKVSFWYSKIDISNKCSWGGWWGFGMDPMMKFHHNYADFPAQIVQ